MTWDDNETFFWGAFVNSTFNNSRIFDSSIFAPAAANVDALAVAKFANAPNDATLTINFNQMVTNPVFHWTEVDRASYDFSPTFAKKVPEPVPILGLLSIAGLGIAMKRNRRSQREKRG